MTIEIQLLKELQRDGDWVNGARLERMEFKGKRGVAKPATVSRILRDLPNDYPNRVEKDYEGRSNSVKYRYIPSKYELLHDKLAHQSALNRI